LSPRSRDLFERDGVDSSRLHIVPNFVNAQPSPSPAAPPDRRWLFVGRLAAEKGIGELIRHWPRGESLDVIGSGPLEPLVIEASHDKGVRFIGSRDNKEVRERLPTYCGLIFPSRWFEGLPTIYLESLAAGTPVAALSGNSAADHVRMHDTGIVVADDDSWAPGLDRLVKNRDRLSANCVRSFGEAHTRDAWLRSIDAVYVGVAGEHAVSK
ncbi:MAG: glycosyltransferase family 4 protein, partial [Actinomycetota bacterium]